MMDIPIASELPALESLANIVKVDSVQSGLGVDGIWRQVRVRRSSLTVQPGT